MTGDENATTQAVKKIYINWEGSVKTGISTTQEKMKRGEELFGNDIITIDEIQKITGGDEEMARQEHREVRESLDYYSEDLLITNYCQYFDLDVDEIIEFLNGLRYEPELNAKLEHPDFSLEPDEAHQVPYVLRHFPFELFDTNVDSDPEDFETLFNLKNEEGGIDGCSTDH